MPYKTLLLSALALLTSATAPVLQAQDKPIRLIVPYAAGEPVPSTPEEFGAFMAKERSKYEGLVKASGARVD